MAKNKYHFLVIDESASGRSIITLPGQVLGRKPVIPRVLVKDIKGRTDIKRAKKTGRVGQVFFTTTLQWKGCCYEAGDIYPVEGCGNVLYGDVQEIFEKYEREHTTPVH